MSATESTESQVSSMPGAASRLTTALRAEFFSTTRGILPWLLVVLPALAVAVRLIAVKLMGLAGSVDEALNSGEGGAVTGYGFFVDGLSTGLILFYLLFIGYAAYSFACDRDTGAVRHLVIRSVSRRAVVLAKFAVLFVLAVIACGLLVLTALGVAALLWDFGPVVEDGFELISESDIRGEILLGLKLAILPLPAALGFGLLVSVLARSATQAVAIAVGITLVVDLFKNALGNLAHYYFSYFHPSLLDESYLGEVAKIVRGFSDVLIDERVHQFNVWLPLPQALLFVVVAVVIVGRRRL